MKWARDYAKKTAVGFLSVLFLFLSTACPPQDAELLLTELNLRRALHHLTNEIGPRSMFDVRPYRDSSEFLPS